MDITRHTQAFLLVRCPDFESSITAFGRVYSYELNGLVNGLGTLEKHLGLTHNYYLLFFRIHNVAVNLNRLVFIPTSRHSSAYVNHNAGTKVVEASTAELCIARHLYKTSDVAAAYNVGRVVALRCREMGLNRIMWEHKPDRNHKRVSLVYTDSNNGFHFVICPACFAA